MPPLEPPQIPSRLDVAGGLPLLASLRGSRSSVIWGAKSDARKRGTSVCGGCLSHALWWWGGVGSGCGGGGGVGAGGRGGWWWWGEGGDGWARRRGDAGRETCRTTPPCPLALCLSSNSLPLLSPFSSLLFFLLDPRLSAPCSTREDGARARAPRRRDLPHHPTVSSGPLPFFNLPASPLSFLLSPFLSP